ncbi:cation:dicarboxylase symporter family transporter [Clostridium estertheticum]|uniref:cation:dicarboxylate symporter family transporter n=1 Tax=Clostridium estertheticum TaxID=238834 RepID=UPI001CF120EF|nr:cation:dicarboxylase symporter family transporter [Clostridium estertheticum]MCB2308926.1 cation:dicarboxylase symporter family transporter [Clostridium estertheticum]MCB2347363.1 cation:dicarboxylase symporter family transporter [Clostridium estertheticum]MCB2351988.1 cation:dicarboxylase symporter family transporter [Clostridium estertheticum]WAG46351.1 cation:dicarboxylase symporter family transporter [Clostridium estertheticum]
MKKLKLGLGTQILIGLTLGVIVGAVFYGNPAVIPFLQPLGDVFIRLIKMIIVPIIFCALVVGIAGGEDGKQIGRLGLKTLIYFEVVTTVAILIGILAGNVFHPGTGIDMATLVKTNISSYVSTTKSVANHSTVDMLVNIVPTNIVSAMAEGNMLSIIFFSVMFGLGISAVGEKAKPVLRLCQGISEAMFWVTNQVMKVAPIGVFGLMGVTVSKFGLKSLIPLGKLTFTVYGCMIFFVLVILGLIAKMVGINIFSLIKVLKDEIILAYTTASSEAVLPRVMNKMESFGCSKSIVSFVIPTGYSFNLDGSTLYQSIAALFIAQLYGVHLSILAQVNLVVVLAITSKGMAGVAGASLVVLLATLGSVGIPLEGVAFVAGIDRILDMARTVVNVVGNSLAAVVMSKWEGKYDIVKGEKYLENIKSGVIDSNEAQSL